jgi:hypothetical protein
MAVPRILIATPTAHGDVCAEFCETITSLVTHFAGGIAFDLRCIETHDLRLVRNVYASLVLADPNITHLLFFDSDMGFMPTLLEKMLAAQKPVVGVVSPARAIDPKAFALAARRVKDARAAEIVANVYIPERSAFRIGYAEDGVTPVHVAHEGSLMPVSRCGTGILLIRRAVFEELRDALPGDYDAVSPQAAAAYGLTGGYLRCFDAVSGDDGTTLGEDLAFASRWIKTLGHDIHLVFDEVIFHVGDRRTTGKAAIRRAYRLSERS